MHEIAIPLQVGYNLANLKNDKRQLIIGWAQSSWEGAKAQNAA